jgi:hypothetical protein
MKNGDFCDAQWIEADRDHLHAPDIPQHCKVFYPLCVDLTLDNIILIMNLCGKVSRAVGEAGKKLNANYFKLAFTVPLELPIIRLSHLTLYALLYWNRSMLFLHTSVGLISKVGPAGKLSNRT